MGCTPLLRWLYSISYFKKKIETISSTELGAHNQTMPSGSSQDAAKQALRDNALASSEWREFCTRKPPSDDSIRAWPITTAMKLWPKEIAGEYGRVKQAMAMVRLKQNDQLQSHRDSAKARTREWAANMTPDQHEKKKASARKWERKSYKTQRGKLSKMIGILQRKSKSRHGKDVIIVVVNDDKTRQVTHSCDDPHCPAQCDFSEPDVADGVTPCYLCGAENAESTDAVIPSLGHTRNNLRAICIRCQYVKKKMTPDELVDHCRAILIQEENGFATQRYEISQQALWKKWRRYLRSEQVDNKDGRRDVELGQKAMFNIFSSSCRWCGKAPRDDAPSGADRLDNHLPYIEGNVVPACIICNRFRMVPGRIGKDLTEEELIAHIKKILAHYADGDG
jgi:hypothetical protein